MSIDEFLNTFKINLVASERRQLKYVLIIKTVKKGPTLEAKTSINVKPTKTHKFIKLNT